ncbi:MAG TPA: hypothetical protein VJB96_01890 [Patescibacteria group bacterium]|nr:hypothetical protein [Patescibacteria group bacterium]
MLQIGRWTLKGFSKQRSNIALYLKLTRKNVDALSDRTLDKSFRTTFDSFCTKYEKLEKEYKDGIADHRIWGGLMKTLAASLTQHTPRA